MGLALALAALPSPLRADTPARSDASASTPSVSSPPASSPSASTPPASSPSSSTPSPTAPPQSSALVAPSSAPAGLAVVALEGATDAAWPLARSIYATASLRPPTVDEAHAHALCGEPVPTDAPADLRDLAETVAALRGDDAPTRAILGDLARRFSVLGLVVVRIDGARPPRATARVFLTQAGAFDAATYAPDDATPLSWSATTRSLVRAFGSDSAAGVVPAAAEALQAPRLATHVEPKVSATPSSRRREFYESGWFWGALGAAAFAGGAVFLATRDSGASAIHLQLEVPH
jgi:hypothetical protein